MGSKIYTVGAGAVSALDWQESVLSIINDPPGAPADGDRHIVGTVPTGVWIGHADAIAEWDGAAWLFNVPNKGYATYVEDVGEIYLWDGSWSELATTPLATTPPVDSNFVAGAVGTGTTAARDDHVHFVDLGLPGAPTVAGGGGGSPSLPGTALVPARADHFHALAAPTTSPGSQVFGAGNPGTTNTAATQDHVHPMSSAAPGSTTIGAVADEGLAATPSRSDHTHGMGSPGDPVDVGPVSTPVIGSSPIPARSDHVHGHGDFIVGGHSNATPGVDGFMALGDKSKLDGIAAGATTDAYAAAVAADWSGAAPATIKAALDRIAAALGPIP
jgi:hypothetical protein